MARNWSRFFGAIMVNIKDYNAIPDKENTDRELEYRPLFCCQNHTHTCPIAFELFRFFWETPLTSWMKSIYYRIMELCSKMRCRTVKMLS